MRIAAIFALLLVSICSYGQKHQLAVVIRGMEYPQGQLMLKVISEDSKTVAAHIIPIDTVGDVLFKIELPTGRYAVSAFYDQNKNESLDKNAIGIPTEKYGFSNNVKGTFGPPSLEEQLFMIDRNMEITIILE